MVERKIAKDRLNDLYVITWRERSKVREVKEGDRNMKYFHIEDGPKQNSHRWGTGGRSGGDCNLYRALYQLIQGD